jgi:predicted transcriptional regulator
MDNGGMENIIDLDYIRAGLGADPKRWEEIAQKSGVPLPTLYKVGKGYTKNPRVGTLQKIQAALRAMA